MRVNQSRYKIHGYETSGKIIKDMKQKENVKMQLSMFDVEYYFGNTSTENKGIVNALLQGWNTISPNVSIYPLTFPWDGFQCIRNLFICCTT